LAYSILALLSLGDVLPHRHPRKGLSVVVAHREHSDLQHLVVALRLEPDLFAVQGPTVVLGPFGRDLLGEDIVERLALEHLRRPLVMFKLLAVRKRVAEVVIKEQNGGSGDRSGERAIELFAFPEFLLREIPLGYIEDHALPAKQLAGLVPDKA